MGLKPHSTDPPHGTDQTASRAALLGIPPHFEIQERLGSGGFGSVYSVLDRRTGQILALKRLERVDPQAIYRFKQEFRLLKGHPHPRLIHLHDLFFEDDRWCFTMDRIAGAPFDSWIRGEGSETCVPDITRATADDAEDDNEKSPDAGTTAPSRDSGPGLSSHPFLEDRLRNALRQLVEGVLELHRLGILHRDLKPSNVLINGEGKLTILDFGIALSMHQKDLELGHILGTPAYMSPEQARGAQLSMASDWYAVGVMLYEALTGHLPFNGTRADMLRARLARDPRPPEHLAADLPPDLCELAMSLLKRDPFERPSGFLVGGRLGLRPSATSGPRHAVSGTFVGREIELSVLSQGFEQSLQGKAVVAHIHGESGLGKTTVVQRFVSDLSLSNQAIVLEGKCFERESVPFKALDGLLDALSRHLSRIPEIEAASLMPRDVRALVLLFPTLGRLPLMKDLGGRPPGADVHELRRRAFRALRELLARLSDTSPLVLVLDDVHWGDQDSADLIEHVLAPPDPPALLLLATYRDAKEPQNPLVQVLTQDDGGDFGRVNLDVPIGPLPSNTAQELALSLLPDGLRTEERAHLIAAESGNSPLFIAELVRAARARKSSGPDVSIIKVVSERTALLAETDRLVLTVLAASERSLSEADLVQVCDISRSPMALTLERLRDEQLISSSPGPDEERFSILHDKVRRAILDSLPADVISAVHGRLARFFERTGAEPETIAGHYLGAGDKERGFRFTEGAGDAAAARSAFNQAVKKYQAALELAPPDQRSRVLRKLAPTLGRAGLGVDAAQVHEQIAALGEEDQELQVRSAGEQYLLAGLTQEALAALAPVLSKHGLTVPRGKLRTAFALLWQRQGLVQRLSRELKSLEKGNLSTLAPEQATAADLSWTLANGFAGIDVFLSVHYSTVTLDQALRARDPERITRALALHAILRALEDGRGQAQADPLLDYAAQFARLAESSHASGWVTGARAILSLNRGDLVTCEELCREALDLLRESAAPSFREIGTLLVWFWLYPSFLLGKVRNLAEHAPALAREAEARGDRYTLSTTRAYVLPLHLAILDQVLAARAEADSGLALFDEGLWLNQHWAHLHSHCFLDLYEGHGQQILKRTEAALPKMKNAYQLRIQAIRIDFWYLEGRGWLELAHQKEAPERSLIEVQKRVTLLEKERHVMGNLYAETLRSGLLATKNRKEGATFMGKLAEQYRDRSMPLHAAAADLRRGELTHGREGEQLTAQAQSALTELGAHNPLRLSWLLIPRVA